jgi:hypothetical protein
MPDKSTVVTCAACGRRNRVPVSATGTPRCGQCGAPLPWLTEAGSDDFDEVVMAADIPKHPTSPTGSMYAGSRRWCSSVTAR